DLVNRLRIDKGESLVVFSGPMRDDGDSPDLFQALRAAVGRSGTIVLPRDEGTLWRAMIAERGGRVSSHPLYPYAAIGPNARFITESAPLHYPHGSNSPLARLHQLNGTVLLLGV